ncbi:MAG: FG-GAP repeat domain-containing protein [Thermodesulfobacteriota bacterium]
METIDFDADAMNDIAIYRTATGYGYWNIIPSSTPGAPYSYPRGIPTDIPVPGDYDGDGKTDLAVWRPGDGYWRILRSSDQGVIQTNWGTGSMNDIPAPGDYNGDKKTDLAVYRFSDGNWYIYPSGGNPPYYVQWGGDPSDIPIRTILSSY